MQNVRNISFFTNKLNPGCHCKDSGNMFADGVALTVVTAAGCGGVIGGDSAVITRVLAEGSHCDPKIWALWASHGFPVLPLGQHGSQPQTSCHQYTNPTCHRFFENATSVLKSTSRGVGRQPKDSSAVRCGAPRVLRKYQWKIARMPLFEGG